MSLTKMFPNDAPWDWDWDDEDEEWEVIQMAEEWKPNFNNPNPYEGMPASYAEQVAQGYVPTAENPMSPVQTAAAAGQVASSYATAGYSGVQAEMGEDLKRTEYTVQDVETSS